jgi:branched-chain amino acid transport system ATP-binding protein
MSDSLLSISNLVVNYGPIQALRGIDLEVGAGTVTALVGANGAGKSTTLLTISGLVRPRRGSILFAGEDISHCAPHRIVERGVVHVPEGRAILSYLTVRENLELGAYTRRDSQGVKRDLDWVLTLFPQLRERHQALAGNLSGGEQQMLAIARGLMAKPRLLLLDEPSMGIAPIIVQEIFRVLVDINRQGLSILLVEQNVRRALKIAQQGYVLETGRIALADSGQRLLDNPHVVAAYLGG